jgi:branched-subunit amino acid aminotransferase/4-amino-4-deoxychorismate lyase
VNFTLINGRIVPAARGAVSVFDHGLLYGDGLYETVRFAAGQFQRWPAHFKRFKSSAKILKLRFPWTSAQLASMMRRLLRANKRAEATVRLTLTRGPGTLGLDPLSCERPMLIGQLHPPRDLRKLRQKGISVAIVKTPSPSSHGTPRLKSLSSQWLVLAKAEAARAGAQEGILLNERGDLAEGSTSNLFFVLGGVLHTPSEECGLLAGVTRAEVLRLAKRHGIRVKQGRYAAQHLKKVDEIFLTNASFGIVPVRGSVGPLTRQLQSLLPGGVRRGAGRRYSRGRRGAKV